MRRTNTPSEIDGIKVIIINRGQSMIKLNLCPE